MEYKAICKVCCKPIGIGTVSSDVFNMAIVIHSMCLTQNIRTAIAEAYLNAITLVKRSPPVKKIQVIEIDYNEFEEIVKRVYGATKYSFVATEECGNDSNHTFEVNKKESLDEWETKDIAEFIEKKGLKTYVNYTLFKDLVNREELEPGQYLVNVCW